MGGLGKGADVNTELSRILGDTSASPSTLPPCCYSFACPQPPSGALASGTQRQWSTETRGPQQSLGTCIACRSPIQSESIQVTLLFGSLMLSAADPQVDGAGG